MSISWFWIALLSPFLWSINNHIDKYLIERYYRNVRPGSLMFLTSIISAIFALCIGLFHHQVTRVPLASALVLVTGGIVYFIAIFPYIHALLKDEASRVVPLFQVGPIFTYLLAWVFLHEQLTLSQLGAGMIIIAAAVAINLDIDNRFRVKKSVLGLMLLSAGLFAVESLIFKSVAIHIGFWSGAFYQYSGTALAGAGLAIFSSGFRHDFLKVYRAHPKQVLTISLFNESLNVAARVAYNYASLLAPLALVSLVTNTQPFFVIMIGIFLTLWLPRFGAETITRRHLSQKIICTAIIFIGTYLLLRP